MATSTAASYSDDEHGASNPLGQACDSESKVQDCGGDEEVEVELDVEEELEEEIEKEVEEEVEEYIEVFEEDYLNSDIEGEYLEADIENNDDEDALEELNDNLSGSLVEHEDDQNDVTQHTESEQHSDLVGGKLKQSCVKNEEPENSVQSKPIAMTEGGRCRESDKEHDGSIPKKRTSNSHIVEPFHMNIDLSKNESTVADTGKPCMDSEIGLASVVQTSMSLAEGSSSVLNHEEEIKQMDMQFGEEIKRRTSRSVTPPIRPKSLSPDAALNDGNKRPATICEFFSKGWCIKGSTCPFLHRKDLTDNTSKHIAVENHKRKLEVDEGPRDDITEGSGLSRSPSIRNKTSASNPSSQSIARSRSLHKYNERTPVLGHQRDVLTGVTRVNDLSFLSSDNPRFMSSFNDVEKECQRQLQGTNDYGNFPVPKSLMPWCDSCSDDTKISLTEYQSKRFPHVERPTNLGNNKSQYNSDDYISPVFGAPLNSGKNLHLLTNTLPDGDYHTVSLTQCSSPFSRSERGPLNLTNYTRVPLNPAYKTNAFSDDWEPSVPFRPSLFVAPSGIPSSPESQYDPLRDSIEHCMPGSNSSTIFPSGHGASIQGMVGSGVSGGKHSFHEFQYKNSAQFEKDLFGTIAGAGESSIAGMDNKKAVPNKAMQLGSANINGFSDYRHRSGGAQHKEFKVDRDTEINSIYNDCKADGGDGQKELRASRHFRAALVDFVKELVKPIWREGHLSKDAHKLIVKKAVDKVLSTLQNDQIPSSGDAVKHYLSSSRHKVLKLVEGYAEKYGKI